MKTPAEVMELIENMAASDHVILHDQAYTPTKWLKDPLATLEPTQRRTRRRNVRQC